MNADGSSRLRLLLKWTMLGDNFHVCDCAGRRVASAQKVEPTATRPWRAYIMGTLHGSFRRSGDAKREARRILEWWAADLLAGHKEYLESEAMNTAIVKPLATEPVEAES